MCIWDFDCCLFLGRVIIICYDHQVIIIFSFNYLPLCKLLSVERWQLLSKVLSHGSCLNFWACSLSPVLHLNPRLSWSAVPKAVYGVELVPSKHWAGWEKCFIGLVGFFPVHYVPLNNQNQWILWFSTTSNPKSLLHSNKIVHSEFVQVTHLINVSLVIPHMCP